MPGAPRAKTVKVQALVNISLSRPEKDADGKNVMRSKLVRKGTVLELTEAEVTNFGRLVAVVDEEHKPRKVGNVAPGRVIGVLDVNRMGKPTLKGSGALDVTDTTRVVQSEAAADWEAQPTNNPIDPSYTGE
jgi:hypothetical protein